MERIIDASLRMRTNQLGQVMDKIGTVRKCLFCTTKVVLGSDGRWTHLPKGEVVFSGGARDDDHEALPAQDHDFPFDR